MMVFLIPTQEKEFESTKEELDMTYGMKLIHLNNFAQGMCIFIAHSWHVETVALLSKGAEQRSGGPLLSADRSGTENGRQQESEGGLLSGGYGFI